MPSVVGLYEAHPATAELILDELREQGKLAGTALRFSDGSFDVCMSQESFLHVADKSALFRECRRVLRAGGRIGFTDWAAQPGLAEDEHDRLRRTFSADGIVGPDRYLDELR